MYSLEEHGASGQPLARLLTQSVIANDFECDVGRPLQGDYGFQRGLTGPFEFGARDHTSSIDPQIG
jgi:hypothetical protein